MIEIERKFLVKNTEFKVQAQSSTRIVQGFLNTHADRTVRVRIKGARGYLTIKGRSNPAGTSRFEWETAIPLAEAESLLNLCEPGILDKVRYEVPVGTHLFEVDEFHGKNQGLIVAEIELQNEDETFEKPDWLGEEVTGQVKYYNSQLAKKPFSTW